MKRTFTSFVVSTILAICIHSLSYAKDIGDLILGKWVRTEKTESFDLNGDKFIPSPWFVSYEFKRGNKLIITIKDSAEDPYPYRIDGNIIKYSKDGLRGEMEILDISNNVLPEFCMTN